MKQKQQKEEFTILRGAAYFRYRLAMATLTGTKIKIKEIRSEEVNPGITEYEADFIRLLQKVTDGSMVKINRTGTKLKYKPGLITNNNGLPVVHECKKSRCISYYLEGLLPLVLFGKAPVNISLQGVTNDATEVSVDTFRSIVPNILTQFGLEETAIIDIEERGIYPDGGGKVSMRCPIVNLLESVNLTEEGKVKRIRGVAFAARTSPQICNRMVETMRGVFVDFIPDVWVHSDHSKAGLSAGYGASVIAETTTGMLISADSVYKSGTECTPETVGKECALRLLDDVLAVSYELLIRVGRVRGQFVPASGPLSHGHQFQRPRLQS